MGRQGKREQQQRTSEQLEQCRSRGHLFALARRCIDVCDDERFIRTLWTNLALWAHRSDDRAAIEHAEKAAAQLEREPGELNQ